MKRILFIDLKCRAGLTLLSEYLKSCDIKSEIPNRSHMHGCVSVRACVFVLPFADAAIV